MWSINRSIDRYGSIHPAASGRLEGSLQCCVPLRACAFYGPSLHEALQKGPRPHVLADHTVCTRACIRGSHNALVRMCMLWAQSRQAKAGSTRESHKAPHLGRPTCQGTNADFFLAVYPPIQTCMGMQHLPATTGKYRPKHATQPRRHAFCVIHHAP